MKQTQYHNLIKSLFTILALLLYLNASKAIGLSCEAENGGEVIQFAAKQACLSTIRQINSARQYISESPEFKYGKITVKDRGDKPPVFSTYLDMSKINADVHLDKQSMTLRIPALNNAMDYARIFERVILAELALRGDARWKSQKPIMVTYLLFNDPKSALILGALSDKTVMFSYDSTGEYYLIADFEDMGIKLRAGCSLPNRGGTLTPGAVDNLLKILKLSCVAE